MSGGSDQRLLLGVAFRSGFLEIQVGLVIGMLSALRVVEQPLDRQELHAMVAADTRIA